MRCPKPILALAVLLAALASAPAPAAALHPRLAHRHRNPLRHLDAEHRRILANEARDHDIQ